MLKYFNKRIWFWLFGAACCIVLDQLSKAAIVSALPLGSSIPITTFFNIVHTLNPGAAFSFLAKATGWQRWFFGGIALVASIILIVLIARKPSNVEAAGYALILGGALGNLADRVARGAVVDWLDFYWGGMHWPAFNLADVWVVSGAGLLILASLRFDRERDSHSA